MILLSGPLANLLLALPLLYCGRATMVAAVHLFSALCNLFPLRTNDGGRAMADLCGLFLPPGTAERTASLISLTALFLLLLLLLFLLLSPGGGGVILLLVTLLARAAQSG